MKRTTLGLMLTLLAASAALLAQTVPSASEGALSSATAIGGSRGSASYIGNKLGAAPPSLQPFSRVALSGGISLMGVNLQAAVNANRYTNLRAEGNFFNYTVSNVNVSGFNVNGKLNFATAGASVDFYPFPSHGFRVSPGILFHNGNALSANMTASAGTSFTLNNTTYYSSASNPVTGNGSVGLHTQSPAFTITTGWGNMIPRRGGHWSFPFEVGAAMIGAPAVNLALTGGQVCSDPQGTVGCQDVVGNSSVNSNLQAQIAKYKSDLEPFRFYPIVSFGVAYSFRLGRGGVSQVARQQLPARP